MKLAVCGNYPRTFDKNLQKIPAKVVAAINSRQLAALVDAMWHQYQAGENQ
jgi:hypothetical protein